MHWPFAIELQVHFSSWSTHVHCASNSDPAHTVCFVNSNFKIGSKLWFHLVGHLKTWRFEGPMLTRHYRPSQLGWKKLGWPCLYSIGLTNQKIFFVLASDKLLEALRGRFIICFLTLLFTLIKRQCVLLKYYTEHGVQSPVVW